LCVRVTDSESQYLGDVLSAKPRIVMEFTAAKEIAGKSYEKSCHGNPLPPVDII